jgi:hypothetical protein
MGALTNYVTITIQRNSVGITRAGFGTLLILTPNFVGTGSQMTRSYVDLASVAVDYDDTSSMEYRAASAALSQDPAPTRIKFGKLTDKPTLKYELSAAAVRNSYTYAVDVDGAGFAAERVEFLSDSVATQEEVHYGLALALNDVDDKNFTATFAPITFADATFAVEESDDTATFTAPHGRQTGDGPFQITALTGGTGLTTMTDYYLIVTGASTAKFASTRALAMAGTPEAVTLDGTAGTLADVATTSSPYDGVVVTGSAAGDWFSLSVVNVDDLALAKTHADPGSGYAAGLTAIRFADPDFYGVWNAFNSNVVGAAIAGWCETNERVFILDDNETEAITEEPGGTDSAADAKTEGYDNTMYFYHHIPAECAGAAWFGACLPDDPGTETWADKQLATITPSPLTQTHRDNLTGKNANGYEQVTSDISVTFEGKTAGGEFFDTTRFLHWFKDDASKGIFGAKVASRKAPMSNPGIAKIETQLRASLARGEERTGFLSGWKVIVPDEAAISDADRATRTLNGVRAYAKLAGAIHKVNVTITVAG